MIKLLMVAVTALIVIVVYINILNEQNATAIGDTNMSILEMVPTFIALAVLGVIAVYTYKSYGDKAGL